MESSTEAAPRCNQPWRSEGEGFTAQTVENPRKGVRFAGAPVRGPAGAAGGGRARAQGHEGPSLASAFLLRRLGQRHCPASLQTSATWARPLGCARRQLGGAGPCWGERLKKTGEHFPGALGKSLPPPLPSCPQDQRWTIQRACPLLLPSPALLKVLSWGRLVPPLGDWTQHRMQRPSPSRRTGPGCLSSESAHVQV